MSAVTVYRGKEVTPERLRILAGQVRRNLPGNDFAEQTAGLFEACASEIDRLLSAPDTLETKKNAPEPRDCAGGESAP